MAKQIGYSYNKFVATAMEDHIAMIESKHPVVPRMVLMAKAAYTQSPPLLVPSYPTRNKKKRKR